MRIARMISFLAMCGMAFALAGSSHAAHAAECDLSASLANLQVIKNDSSLNDQDRLVKELTVRKQALKNIVHCATQNAALLKDGLANATTTDNTVIHLENQFANQINDSLNYYSLKENLIDNLGLQGTKDFANDLGTWRKSSELPLETQISAFLLWHQNQPIIMAAQNRLVQITHVIASLDLSGNQNIMQDFLDAKHRLGDAVNSNAHAEILIASNNPQDAISTITDSLSALKNVYQDFFTISESVTHTFASK